MTTLEYATQIEDVVNGYLGSVDATEEDISCVFSPVDGYIGLGIIKPNEIQELYFAQGEDASTMREQVDKLAKVTGCAEPTCLLYILFCAGAI